MNGSLDDTSRWLRSRPLQDTPRYAESAGPWTSDTWNDWIEKGRAIPELENTLIQMLKHERDPVTRSAAAMALGFVGANQSIAFLIQALATDIPIVAMEAAASLGRLGNVESLEPLCEALKNPDVNVRANACYALGQIGGEEALSCLRNAASDPDSFVRTVAETALRRTS
jgi:HEAT repeat protein